MFQANIISHSTLWIIRYHLLCQRTPIVAVIDASHTTPITRINRGPKLLKLIGWRHYPCFKWVPYIPGTIAQTPSAEPGPTAR